MSNLKVGIIGDCRSAIEALGKTRLAASNLEKGLSKISRSVSTIGNNLNKNIAIPSIAVATGFSWATKEAITFEKGMREVYTLLPGLSKEGMDKLNDDVIAFAKNLGVLPSEVVPALYQSFSAGVPEENVFQFLETSLKASVGGVADLTSAVDGISSVVNAYGEEVISAAEASDLMFTSVRKGKTTFPELSRSLYNVIPTAAAAGVSFSDVSASIATITAQGTPTAQATTQIRQAIIELNKSSSVTSKLFKEISGKSFKDFISEGHNFNDALSLMHTHAEKNNVSVSDLFSSIEAGAAVLQLTGESSDEFVENLQDMENSAGATEKAFNEIAGSVGQQLKEIKGKLSALTIELGEKFLPVVSNDLIPFFEETLLPTLEDTVEIIGKIIKGFNNLSPETKKLITVLGLLTIGSGTLLKSFSSILTTSLELRKSFKVFPVLIKNISSSFGAVGMAGTLIGTIFLAVQGLKEIGKFLDDWDEKKNHLKDTNFAFERASEIIGSRLNNDLSITNEMLDTMSEKYKISKEELLKLVGLKREQIKLEKEAGKAVDTFDERHRNASQNYNKNVNARLKANKEEQDALKDKIDTTEDLEDKEEDYWVRKAKFTKLSEDASVEFYEKEHELALFREADREREKEEWDALVNYYKEKNQWLTDIFTETLSSMGETIGEQLVLQGDVWGALGKIAINTVANIISALGSQAFVESAKELAEGFAHLSNPFTAYLAPADFAASAKWAAAGTLASVAAGAVRALPQLAGGGLTTGATTAVIGEGKYQEAVLPLSDDVFKRLAEGITRTENYNNSRSSINLNIYFSSQFDISDNSTKRKAIRELQPLIISSLKKAGAI